MNQCFRHMVVALIPLLLLPSATHARADDLVPATRAASLEDRLKAGLRTRLPAEDDFVERVVMLVRTGKIPAKLVDSTYIWAIDRQKEYPFPAFEKALRAQAERLGIRL
ncbi:MAG: hypothetical protein ACKOYJ_11850 [Planctomycetia bacterium]